MSREAYEQSKAGWEESEFPRGPGDPDFFGYPGEPKLKEVHFKRGRRFFRKLLPRKVPF